MARGKRAAAPAAIKVREMRPRDVPQVVAIENASSASADLRKFSHTPDNYLWVVGTSGTVLRTRLVPDATFSAPDTLRFGTLCPGETARRTLTIGNTGLGVLATLVILGDAVLTQLIIRFIPCQPLYPHAMWPT